MKILGSQGSERKGQLNAATPNWLDSKHVINVDVMGDSSEIAQVNPYLNICFATVGLFIGLITFT